MSTKEQLEDMVEALTTLDIRHLGEEDRDEHEHRHRVASDQAQVPPFDRDEDHQPEGQQDSEGNQISHCFVPDYTSCIRLGAERYVL